MNYSDLFDLRNKVALVIGGAGGIGQEICKAYAEYGANVVIGDIKVESASEIKSYIEGIGRKCLLYKVNILEKKQIIDMVENLVKEFEHIDILLNSAGTQIWQKAEEYTEEAWDKVMDLNIKGIFMVSREVGKQMIKQGGGKIINISSVRSILGYQQDYTAYCASKGAVNMYTKALAVEWAKYNINVNAIAPTFTETNLVKDMLKDRETEQTLINRIPLKKLAKPSDHVGTIIYLSSKASDYITGQIVFSDGGLTATQ
ncbi:MAG: SDR family NAD(P)-dependent oxidoreductase [Candidatus Humimicrobiaceae bacterium]